VKPEDLKTLRKGVLAGLDSGDQGAPWLARAPEDQRQAMLDCLAASVASSHALARSLKGLKGITEFAEPLLANALLNRFGTAIDINQNRLYHLRAQAPRIEQSLLQAALLNFERDTAFDDVRLQETSAIAPVGALLEEKDGPQKHSTPLNVTYQPYRYRYTEKLPIKPADFAELCRTLDLGQQYQDHLDSVFDGAHRELVRQQMIRARTDLMAVHARRALMKGYITEHTFTLVQAVLSGDRPRYNGHEVVYSELELLGSALGEVLVIGCRSRAQQRSLQAWQLHAAEAFLTIKPSSLFSRSLSANEQKIIVYLPGAGRYEWAEYASVEAFEKTLAAALRAPAMQQLFLGWVKHDEQSVFQQRLKAQRYGKRWNPKGFYEQIDNPEPHLAIKETLLPYTVLDALHERHQTRMRDNARLWAVPTAVVDNEAMWARLKHYAEVGLDVLNVAAFFVPVLGHIMLAVTAVQLSLEVYHGIEAWSVGDREQAWAHFESVALNLGFAAALAGAGAAARFTPKVQASEWVNGLVPVTLPNGDARLWAPEIAPYRSAVELDPALQPNAMGQYEVDGKTYVRLDNNLYETTYDGARGTWRIQHPDDPHAFQPELDHNQAGAWRHRHERPLEWDRLTLLRRIGPDAHGLSDDALQQVAQVCDVHDDALRKMHMDRTPPPPMLAETLKQFKADHAVDEMVEDIRSGRCVKGVCEYAVPLLVQMPNWPEGEVLEVFRGPELWGESQRYGGALTQPSIKITRGQIMKGQLPAQVISALDEQQLTHLLGEGRINPPEQRQQVFRERLATFAAERKRALFDSIYRNHATPGPDVERLQRHFPGLPDPAARFVLEHASAAELKALRSTGRIPLRLAQQIRVHVQQAALNRALGGLYLESMASAASDRLALHSLEHLPGWPVDLRVEVRADSMGGALLDSIGSEQAPMRHVLVKQGDSFQAFDQQGRVLNPKPRLGRNLFESLAAVRPRAMATEQPLQQQLASYASAHRDDMARLLKLRPINTGRGPGLRLPSGRLGYLASGRGAGFADGLLVRRARMIYPNLSDEQASAFINQHLRGGKTDQQMMHMLNNRQREFDALAADLTRWIAADQAARPYDMPSRRTIAERIVAAWREGVDRDLAPATELDLRDADRLAPWEADFSHVRALSVQSEQLLGEEGAELLARFPGVKRLNISVQEAHLPALKQKLGALSTITELSLDAVDVPDDLTLSTALHAMPQLEALYLLDWHQPLELGPLRALRVLQVRGAMSSWPAGVFDLPELDTLDLRGTAVHTLPEPLFGASERLLRGLTLDWAQLDPPAFIRLYEHRISRLPHQIAPQQWVEAYCHGRLQRLMPTDLTYADAVLARLKGQGFSGRALLEQVADLQQEHAVFNQNMEEWQNRVVQVDRRQVDLYVRKHAAEQIRQCWYRAHRTRYAPVEPVAGPSWRTPVSDEMLDLAGGPLGDLPSLPDTSFDHVRYLDLTGARLTASNLEAFLGKFPNLRQLNLNGNRLAQLPAALDGLVQLEQLQLSRNELSITPSLQQRLNRLTGLKRLNLSYNRVEVLSVQQLPALEDLDLSHTAIRNWPAGSLALTNLRRLDLSRSAITHIPEALFSGHEPLLAGLQVQGCRLTTDTMAALQRTRLELPGGIARERLSAGRTGDAPEFFPVEVAEDPNLLLPLPLEAPGGDSLTAPALRLQRLDPELSTGEAIRRIDDLREQGLGALEIEARLDEWHNTHRQLVASLNRWIDVRAYREGDDWITAVHRRRAADRVLACWRQGLHTPVAAGSLELDISQLDIGDLPELPVGLDHVGTLNVSSTRMTAQHSNGFFRSFTHLEHVKVNGNALVALPESLAQCESLTRLDAHYNDFRDSDLLHALLTRFGHLEQLDLGNNTLATFSVTGLDRLQTLDLRGNLLDEWPEGVLEAPALTRLNLSNNQIETIPADALLATHDRLIAGTDISDNLLQEEDLRRLRDHLEETGRGLGFSLEEIDRTLEGYALSDDESGGSSDDEAHPGDETLAEQKPRWFAGVAADSEKHQVWERLAAEEGGADFFNVLSQLRHTEDFVRDRADLVRRVWQVLQAANDSERLRDELFSLARTLRVRETCGDGRILLFNDLEIKAYEFDALKTIEPEHKGRELLKLSRGLFRLGKVEDVARAAIQRRPRIDPAEIRLAYRIGLAERLGLPRQPKTMTYANLAQVTARDLDEAYAAILQAQGQPEFVEQLLGRSYWMDYLEEQYAAEFTQLQQRFEAGSEALEEQYPDFDAAYFDALDTLDTTRKAERRQLALRLSQQELGQPPA
jgi:Leucine-rich repeat (LRR) protein